MSVVESSADRGAWNAWFDRLPRPNHGHLWRRGPTFRACGVVGFYVATLTVVLAALVTHRSLWIAALLSVVCAWSFVLSTYLRRWITGHEELVLLEQVWFAEIVVALVLVAFDVPLLENLDLLAVALCPFLAGGRTGCLLVGCCHGKPSSFGIVYGHDCADEGFARHLVGVRLFPVQPIEGLGLLAIGFVGFGLLFVAPVGTTFVWFLVAYAIMRYGLEELRGDRRPYLFGLSQAQWMSIAEIGLALGMVARPFYTRHPAAAATTAALLSATIAIGLVVRKKNDLASKLLEPEHLVELRSLVARLVERGDVAPDAPGLDHTSRAVGVAVTADEESGWHASLSLPSGRHDLELLCRVARCALPECEAASAHTTNGSVLHLRLSGLDPSRSVARDTDARALYGAVVRSAQGAVVASSDTALVEPPTEALPGREAYFGATERSYG